MEQYNNIYELLVLHEKDMAGRIAYSLYKKEKIEWIKQFKIDNKRKPSPSETEKQFHAVQRQQGCVQRYKIQAENILQEFTDKALEQSVTQIENECRKDILGNMTEKESLGKRYLHGILQSIIASVILAFLIWLFVVVVNQFSIGNLQIEFKYKEAPTDTIKVETKVSAFFFLCCTTYFSLLPII